VHCKACQSNFFYYIISWPGSNTLYHEELEPGQTFVDESDIPRNDLALFYHKKGKERKRSIKSNRKKTGKGGQKKKAKAARKAAEEAERDEVWMDEEDEDDEEEGDDATVDVPANALVAEVKNSKTKNFFF
jgi:hypothetical protein